MARVIAGSPGERPPRRVLHGETARRPRNTRGRLVRPAARGGAEGGADLLEALEEPRLDDRFLEIQDVRDLAATESLAVAQAQRLGVGRGHAVDQLHDPG